MERRQTIPSSVRFRVLERDQFKCWYCGRSSAETTLVIDHFIPLAEGGTSGMDNLVSACVRCNQGKGTRTCDRSLADYIVSRRIEDNIRLIEAGREMIPEIAVLLWSVEKSPQTGLAVLQKVARLTPAPWEVATVDEWCSGLHAELTRFMSFMPEKLRHAVESGGSDVSRD